jgi:hypothetical protein
MPSDATTRRWATGIAAGSVLLVVTTAVALYIAVGRMSAPAYAAGQQVDLPATLYAGAPRTLLVIARSSCGGCQAAKPWLRDLVDEARRAGPVRVALLVEKPEPAEHAFAREIGVAPEDVVAVELTRFKVRRVPTILLVDGGGAIRFSHEDAPDAPGVAALLATYREALRQN